MLCLVSLSESDRKCYAANRNHPALPVCIIEFLHQLREAACVVCSCFVCVFFFSCILYITKSHLFSSCVLICVCLFCVCACYCFCRDFFFRRLYFMLVSYRIFVYNNNRLIGFYINSLVIQSVMIWFIGGEFIIEEDGEEETGCRIWNSSMRRWNVR